MSKQTEGTSKNSKNDKNQVSPFSAKDKMEKADNDTAVPGTLKPSESHSDEPEQNKPTGLSENSDSKKTSWRVVGGAIISILVLVVILVIVMGVGIYNFGWNDSFTKEISRIVPYPIVKVDSNFLAYSDFRDNLATLNFFYDAQEEINPELVQKPSDEFLNKSLLSQMIRENYLASIAGDFNVSVTAEDIDNEYDNITSQAGGVAELEKTLTELYSWQPEDFKAKVIEPYLIRQGVQDELAKDEELTAATLQEAQDVLAMLNEGEKTFEELAKEYSDDVTASAGGDLGFFSKGDMVPEFEEAVLALEPDQVSDIVQTQFGYHIIKLIERVPADDEGGEHLHAAHILFETQSIDDWLKEKLSESNISIYAYGYEWKADCGFVLDKAETCEDNDLMNYLTDFDTTGSSVPTEGQ